MLRADTHRYSARLIAVDRAAIFNLPLDSLEAASVSLDIDRTPYVVASLTMKTPPADVVALLDPRRYPVILIEMFQDYAATDLVPNTLADVTADHAPGEIAGMTTDYAPGTIAGVSADYPGNLITTTWTDAPSTAGVWMLFVTDIRETNLDGLLTVELSSAEFLLEDRRRVASTTRDMSGQLDQVVAAIAADVNASSEWYGPAAVIAGEEALLNPGESWAEFIDPILETYDQRIYSLGYNSFTVSTIGKGFGAAQTLAADYRIRTLTSFTRNLSTGTDAGWYDAVVITYQWTDAAGVSRTNWDVAEANGPHRRARHITRDKAYPGQGAAAGILRRSEQRGFDIGIGMVSNYAVTPSWDCNLILPDTNDRLTNWAIRSVEFAMPDAEMRLTLQTKHTGD